MPLLHCDSGIFYIFIRKMTINEVLQLGDAFSQDKIGRLALEILLSFSISKSREYIFAHPEDIVSDEDIKNFTSLVKRHLNGEPVAYITGEKEFYGMVLSVDNRVLIPRPETEYLVDKIIETVEQNKYTGCVNILDVGTGSGNIAIAVANNISSVNVTACDVSQDALEVAKKNVKRYNLEGKVELVLSDLLKDLKEKEYQIVVANLPYIGTEKHNFVSIETKNYEPHEALFGGFDGLRLYEQLFEQILAWRKMPDYVFGEIGFLQGDELQKLVKQFYPHASVSIEKDLSGLDRYFIIKKLC